ncbi:hypothetical protein [Nocardioides humi]|uniref:hypothetical protein n=1 Tax=Nocardioides humi TaxID=449461 RepID=UPI00112CD63A|nr:hypothetical protein [Nocardioides humi]
MQRHGRVTVVVDAGELGAGISAGCDPSVAAGEVAAKNFADAGYTIEYSQASGMSGFVCKVNGNPADGHCTETDAYWSLWWSDGRSGTWIYANRGVGGLKVPDGGYVAFSWHQGAGKASPPDVAATPRATAPKPSASPSPTKSGQGGKGKSAKKTGKATPSATPSPSASSTTPTTSPSASPSTTAPTEAPTDATSTAAPSDTPSQTATSGLPSIDEITDGPEATSADAGAGGDDDGSGFPAWLGVGLVVVVLGAAAAVPLLRRRGAKA